eukprot:336699_1
MCLYNNRWHSSNTIRFMFNIFANINNRLRTYYPSISLPSIMKYFSIFIFITVVFGNKCAYTTTGGIVATPLGSCSTFSQTSTTGQSFSFDFSYENDKLNWNYYSDLDCKRLLFAANPSDGLNIQPNGKGNSCDTVDITKKGSFSPYSDDCSVNDDTMNDYYTMSYVVNECITSSINGQDFSAILFCNKEKVYFNFYTDCNDCSSKCRMKQYLYHYYDTDDCWDIVCNSNSKYTNFIEMDSAHIVNDASFFKTHINNYDYKISMLYNKRDVEYQLQSKVSSTSYSYIGAIIIFTIFCMICRYINSYNRKEYTAI